MEYEVEFNLINKVAGSTLVDDIMNDSERLNVSSITHIKNFFLFVKMRNVFVFPYVINISDAGILQFLYFSVSVVTQIL